MADLNDDDSSGDSDINHDKGDETVHTPPRKRICQHYKTKWQAAWTKKFSCIERVSDYQAKCTVCCRNFSTEHMGERDIVRHLDGKDHKKKTKEIEQTARIDDLFKRRTADDTQQITNAEVLFTGFLIEHNIPLAVSDHAGPIFRQMFPDSSIAKRYSCARTKTTSILNGAMAPEMKASLVELMKVEPFSICIDGSNDNDLNKMYPLCVRLFDVNRGQVCLRFLEMCSTSSSTAEGIFTEIHESLSKHELEWQSCVAFSVDNTSVNLGRRNSIMTRVLEKNNSVYFMGCPCHIVHNSASHSSKAFAKTLNFDVGDLCVDVFYWFDYSTKRKNLLAEFCTFCDIDYRKILKYMSVRWLNLEIVVERILSQYEGLRAYFLSEDDGCPRLQRLKAHFENPMTEVYLMFYQAVLPIFTHINLLLQRDAPMIYAVQDSLFSLIRKLLGKFIQPELLVGTNEELLQLEFLDTEKQVSDSNLFIGFMTKQLLNRLDDTVDPNHFTKFYTAVRNFYTSCVTYMKKNFPLNQQVLRHASFVNYETRLSVDISSVEFFINRYPNFFRNLNLDDLHDELIAYKTSSDLPDSVVKLATVTGTKGQNFLRMDIVWEHLSKVKDASGNLKFPILSKVAKLVLTIPHSNADAERVFSMIGKNKIKSRADLALEGTLSSITTCKVNQFFEVPCHEFRPSKTMLNNAKKATWNYNKAHKN